MNTVSAYVFRQVLTPLLAILGALAAIAILTQGLNQLDIIIGNRNAGFYNPTRANAYRTAAVQLYAWGRKNGAVQQLTFSAWEPE